MSASKYFIGLDLGEKRDYTALAVLRRRMVPTGGAISVPAGFDLNTGRRYEEVPAMEATYEAFHLDRWRGKGYLILPGILEKILRQIRQADFDAQAGRNWRPMDPADISILVDHTGVGVAVLEELRAAGVDCYGITITAGDRVNRDGQDLRVPKRELVAATQVLLESQRLRIAAQLPLAPVVTDELLNFRMKKTTLGNDTYGAGEEWRDAAHDDLVLAIAMAGWFGEYHVSSELRPPTGALADYLEANW